jgi:hypothetical protein
MPKTEPQSRGHSADLLRIVGVLVVIAIAAFLGTRSIGDDIPSADPTDAASPVIVGEPGGGVVLDPSAAASPASASQATEPPPSSPDPQPTQEPVATATPAAATGVAAATEAPGPVGVAIAGPADVVAAFYEAVVDGRFDAAYSHWSSRMRANFPRRENLDERFDNTSAITFQQLSVAEIAGTSATVQANFTEMYDTGESRQFIGYWRLVQVESRWLLDDPHY